MKSLIIWLAFASVTYSQQQVWIQQGNPYDQMRMQQYLLDKGVKPEDINPPIGYSHGILRYPPVAPPRLYPHPADWSQLIQPEKNSKAFLPWLIVSALVARVIGPKFGHRKWTSFTAGLLLGPLGILLVTGQFTLQRPTAEVSRIVEAKMINPQQPVWDVPVYDDRSFSYKDG